METELQGGKCGREEEPTFAIRLVCHQEKKGEVEPARLLSAVVLLSWLAVFTGSERRGRGATLS